MTREEWLNRAAGRLLDELIRVPASGPAEAPALKLSFGWPKGKKRSTIGQCFSKTVSADGKTFHIFISPRVADTATVLSVLVHELVHAAVGTEAGHRGDFIRVAKRVGLVKPWTATTASPELAAKLAGLAGELGELPHVAMDVPGKTQTTRMKLWECGCGVKIRRAGELNARCLDCGTLFARRD